MLKKLLGLKRFETWAACVRLATVVLYEQHNPSNSNLFYSLNWKLQFFIDRYPNAFTCTVVFWLVCFSWIAFSKERREKPCTETIKTRFLLPCNWRFPTQHLITTAVAYIKQQKSEREREKKVQVSNWTVKLENNEHTKYLSQFAWLSQSKKVVK